jgi:hypothetical protein
MKTSRYAVSVQWGNWLHYFIRSDFNSRRAAESFGKSYIRRLSRHLAARGTKPKVFVWVRANSFSAVKSK